MTSSAPTTPAPDTQGVGVRIGDQFDKYFEGDRPELRALIPMSAKRVLDVGCGTGSLGAGLKAQRPDVVVMGLEGFPAAAKVAKERLDDAFLVNLDAIEALPDGAGTFDAIVFGDVLEHLVDPERLLGVMRAALNPGGVLIMSIPNVNHWSLVAPLVLYDSWPYADAGLLDQSHVHLFTLGEISNLAERLSLEVTYLGVNDHLPVPGMAVPFVSCLTASADDLSEAAARLGAYQYLVVAGPTDGAPGATVSAGVGPRQTDPHLNDVVPAGYVRRDVAASVPAPAVLDNVVDAEMAAWAPKGEREALVFDGVFAHIREPERVMAVIADTLRADDVAVFSVRNVGCWDTLGPLTIEDKWAYGEDGPLRDHPIRFYTASGFAAIVEQAGLDVVRSDETSVPLPAQYVTLRAAAAVEGANNNDVASRLERQWMRLVVRRRGSQ